MMVIGKDFKRFRERGHRNEGTPPNAPIDHWPAACNRLDSLDFRARQRMLILEAGQTCH